jgi:hypothetical protein
MLDGGTLYGYMVYLFFVLVCCSKKKSGNPGSQLSRKIFLKFIFDGSCTQLKLVLESLNNDFEPIVLL